MVNQRHVPLTEGNSSSIEKMAPGNMAPDRKYKTKEESGECLQVGIRFSRDILQKGLSKITPVVESKLGNGR